MLFSPGIYIFFKLCTLYIYFKYLVFKLFSYRCDVARSTLIDSIVNKYKEAIDEYRNLIEGDEEPDEDEIFNVVQSLKKVSIFYACHNMNPWGIWDSLYKDIEDAKDPSKYFSLYL